MFCRYCGDEIVSSRLLKDTAFCCDTHREAYRERHSKVSEPAKGWGVPLQPAAPPPLPSLPPLAPRPQGSMPERSEFKFKLRYTEKPAKLGASDTILPPALTPPLAVAPPPPAGATPLAAAPLERLVEPAAAGLLVAQQADPELPAFAIGLRQAAPASGPAEEEWMRMPAAAPVERISMTHGALAVAFQGFSAIEPVMGCLALADPASTMQADTRHAIPEPRAAAPTPRTAGPMRTVAMVTPEAHRPLQRGYFPDGPEQPVQAMPDAEGARSLATPVSGKIPAAPQIRLPQFEGAPAPHQGLPSASFAAADARPAVEAGVPRQIHRAPVSTVTLRTPEPPAPIEPPAMRMAGMMPLEYFCSRGPRSVAHGMGWIIPAMAVTAPRFAAPLSVERIEPLPQAPKEKRKRPAFAEIFTLPEAASRRSTTLRDLSKIIAACLVIGAMLWYGVSYVRSNHDEVIGTLSPAAGQNRSASNHGNPAAAGSGGFFSRVRSAISRRAEAHLGDDFQDGMAAWGAPEHALPPGWARNPDGYVTTGKLALFQPTVNYTDYRVEFFGQIESKSMDWAVRASDDANYYAMKFATEGTGPRASMIIVHYPVVAGIKGRRVVTPLNIMADDRTPYRVAVDVRGDRITTSVEGQEIDSFEDATLTHGGIGFFADAGERARLYWIKVSKNEDWLGRVCAFLSGSNSASAQLWPPRGTLPRPGSGTPGPANQLALAAGFGFMRRNVYSRISDHGRFPSWRS